jgi:cytochrome oxidase Cu insertion factor (SCO1/SenC/PrrC family)
MLVLAAYALTQLGGGAEQDIPSLFPVPAFELTDQEGAIFRSETLRGRVWVASFLFTSCSQACPTLAAQLANVRARLAHHGDRFHVVSVSVDPEVDTPARLREFAERFGGASHWTLLTGAPADVRAATERAFFQPEARRTYCRSSSPTAQPIAPVVCLRGAKMFAISSAPAGRTLHAERRCEDEPARA